MNVILRTFSLRRMWPRPISSTFGNPQHGSFGTCPVLRPNLESPKRTTKGIWSDDFATTLQEAAKTLVETVDLSKEGIKTALETTDEKDKEILGSFWKKSLAFNPLFSSVQANIDLRFMKSQVDDPVYKLFEREALSEGKIASLYLLCAISGAGKTATILNAIGRNAFTLYVQCDVEQEGREDKDYLDTPFMSFILNLTEVLDDIPNKREATSCCQAHCLVFWLCRLALLEAMQNKYPKLTAEQWIWWTNGSGQQSLFSLQNEALIALESVRSQLQSWKEMTKPLTSLMKSCHNRFPDVWFAIDEAQIIQTSFEEQLISGVGSKVHPTTLLHMLAVHSLRATKALTLVAGTRMSHFDELIGTYGGKGTSIFKLNEVKENYPYVTGEEALQHLSEWINLDGITTENLNLAKSKLQGRLRYVFGFLRYLYLTARQRDYEVTKEEEIKQKNDLFVLALNRLLNDLSKNIQHQWERVMTKHNILPAAEEASLSLSIVTFPEHILTLLMDHLSNQKLTWDSDYLKKHFGIAPEDTGFLYFDKDSNPEKPSEYKYVYSIKEPQLVPFLVNMLQGYFPQKALHSLVTKAGPSDFGSNLELIFGIFMMSPNFHVFLSKHSGNVDWCKNLTVQWDNVNFGDPIAAIKEAMDVLQELKEVDKNNENSLQDCLEKLLNTSLFYNYPKDDIPKTDINLLLDIATLYNASDDVARDLLFMYAKPHNFLLRPSVSMGPDLVGFCRTSEGHEVLVLVSLSFTPSFDRSKMTFKFEKNRFKQEPACFYSQLKEADKIRAKHEKLDYHTVLTPIAAKAIFEKIALPDYTLMLHVTMPDANQHYMDSLGGNTVRIYINQSNLKDLSTGLDELLNNKLQTTES